MRSFLTAEWLNLVMLNYEAEPAVLKRLVPVGCELDLWEGRAFLSVVAFQFFNTRLLGIRVPGHRNFEEVNLRFYVRHKSGEEWRRGVVFVKELVPRRALAFTARAVYGENYVALPMRHAVTREDSVSRASYEWQHAGAWEGVWATHTGPPQTPPDGSAETFITEHYWGYSRQRDGSTVEYQVEHPRWQVWPAEKAALDCDVAALYGAEFVESMTADPSSAFVADGSPIVVRMGRRL
jgi:uncharacterized protein